MEDGLEGGCSRELRTLTVGRHISRLAMVKATKDVTEAVGSLYKEKE